MSNVDDIAEAIERAAPLEPLPPNDRELADLPRNDYGNGRRLIARHGRDLLHVDERGWYVWDGRRFAAQPAKEAPDAVRLAHATAAAIKAEARALKDDRPPAEDPQEWGQKHVDPHLKFAVASGNAGRINAMLASAAPYVRVRPDHLDPDGYALNVANGTIDLAPPSRKRASAGKPAAADDSDPVRFRAAHDRAARMTHLAPVAYDPEAGAPAWDKFLARVQPEAELRAFLQRLAGYCLTGDTSEQVMALMHGKGANGKTTFIETVAAALGDYAVTLPIATFLQNDRRSGGEATPDLVRLPGARLVRTAEPERGARLSESLIKSTTGADVISARPLFAGMFDFLPTFKLVISANERPRISGQDEGIWRRVLLVPWDVVIPRAERDPHLKAARAAELPGVVNWMLDGYRMWRERELAPPAAVLAATETYRTESDPIGEFVRVCIEAAPGATIKARDLYHCYVVWAKANAIDPRSATAFGLRLADRGFVKVKAGTVLYQGCRLTPVALLLLDEAKATGQEPLPPAPSADDGADGPASG